MSERIQFTGRVTIEASAVTDDGEEDGPKKRPRFSIEAYSGSEMRVAGHYSPVILDLAGLRTAKERIPILFNHDPAQVVGMTDEVSIDSKGVRLAGSLTGEDATTRSVIAHARNGFQWAASVGADIGRSEFLKAGEKATVNGRSVTGPMTIVRAGTLFETSLVAVGADPKASASLAAKGSKHMSEFTSEETIVDEVQSERDRCRSIQDVCGRDHAEIAARAIESGLSVGEVKGQVLDVIRARSGGHLPRHRPEAWVEHGGDDQQTLEATFLVRAGLEKLAVEAYGEQATESARHMRASSFVDLCATALRIDHKDPSGMNRSRIIADGFSTLSLPTALSNVTGKALLPVYMQSTASWRGFATVRPAVDFKPQVGIRPSFIGELEKLAPAGEIKHGLLAESTYPWSISTYAKMFTVDRTSVINDDLGFISEVPMMLGMAAARKVNDLVWGVIINGTTSGSPPYFGTAHNNLLSGAGSAIGLTGLGAAMAAMRTQRDAQNNDIQIIPRVLAVPPELEAPARGLVISELIGSDATTKAPTGNPFYAVVDVEVESRLSNVAKFGTGASTTAWYIFGGPESSPVIVGFLDGVETPVVESFGMQTQPDRLAMSFRCWHDVGAALGDSRAGVRSAGV